MPFTKGSASEAGKIGGSVTSEKKAAASRKNGLLGSGKGGFAQRPLVCTCDQYPHKSNCRAYMTIKKRESRKRLK